jgi:hypothetical protein
MSVSSTVPESDAIGRDTSQRAVSRRRTWRHVVRDVRLSVPDEEASVVTSLDDEKTDLGQWIVPVEICVCPTRRLWNMPNDAKVSSITLTGALNGVHFVVENFAKGAVVDARPIENQFVRQTRVANGELLEQLADVDVQVLDDLHGDFALGRILLDDASGVLRA